jgi:ORF6N domain
VVIFHVSRILETWNFSWERLTHAQNQGVTISKHSIRLALPPPDRVQSTQFMRVQNPVVPLERIERAIFFLRGHKVILSTHLAELYEVEPRVLVQAVKRNIERFPPDFIFQLSKVEFQNLKSQIVTSNWGGLRRAAPAPSYPGIAWARG